MRSFVVHKTDLKFGALPGARTKNGRPANSHHAVAQSACSEVRRGAGAIRAVVGTLAPLIASLLLAACGNNASQPDPTPTSTATATASRTDTPTATLTQTSTTTPTYPATSTVTRTLTPTATRTPTSRPTATTPPCDTPGVICTVAGSGLAAFDGDGKPALRTAFYFPFDVAFDRAGRALILDFNNLRLRRINYNGTIQTVMGTDFEGAPGEGGLASETALHHASSIEVDQAGMWYIAGYHAPYVFRVGTDERVSVLAGIDDVGYRGDGGPARDATLSLPYGVLPTNDGGFYIADFEAHVIRYVDSAGIIRTVAGTGVAGYSGDGGAAIAATLNGPTRLALDARGALYFCDTKNHAVRRLDREGIITTIAGDGIPGYAGDGGPATEAQLTEPYDLEFSSTGDLYVADSGNNVVRRIGADRIISTVVGTGERGFSGDGGPADNCKLNKPTGIEFSAGGDLWISDTLNQRVRRVARFVAP